MFRCLPTRTNSINICYLFISVIVANDLIVNFLFSGDIFAYFECHSILQNILLKAETRLEATMFWYRRFAFVLGSFFFVFETNLAVLNHSTSHDSLMPYRFGLVSSKTFSFPFL